VTTRLVGRDNHPSQRTVIWLIPVLLTAHNAEEAIAYTLMRSQVASLLPGPLGTLEARLSLPVVLQVLAILSALAFILAGVVVLRPRLRAALWLLLALEAAVALNVVAHVASAVAIFHGYGPGLATAVLVNAPFAVYALGRARREAWVSRGAWLMLAVGGLFLHGPVLIGALWLAGRRPG
jgi:hypothetical protein